MNARGASLDSMITVDASLDILGGFDTTCNSVRVMWLLGGFDKFALVLHLLCFQWFGIFSVCGVCN